MCGVPFHSYEGYVARLIAKGYKVAICEQVEDPAKAKGLVKRDIIRVVTPGTIIESSMLQDDKNNYIASIFIKGFPPARPTSRNSGRKRSSRLSSPSCAATTPVRC